MGGSFQWLSIAAVRKSPLVYGIGDGPDPPAPFIGGGGSFIPPAGGGPPVTTAAPGGGEGVATGRVDPKSPGGPPPAKGNDVAVVGHPADDSSGAPGGGDVVEGGGYATETLLFLRGLKVGSGRVPRGAENEEVSSASCASSLLMESWLVMLFSLVLFDASMVCCS